MILILLFLFSILLCPEIVNLDFTIELRPLIFAVFATVLTGRIGVMEWWNNGVLEKSKFKFVSIDHAYIATIFLAIISFITKAQCINAFHFVFVQVGMAVVYFFIRTTKKNTSRKFTPAFAGRLREVERAKMGMKIPQTPFMKGGIIVGIGFIVAMIGLIQFVLGKPVVSTFGRTSYLGCFLAMNAAIALGTMLQLRVTNYKLRFKKFNIGFWLAVFAFLVIFGVTILTKSRTAMIAMAVVLPIIVFATKTRRLKEKKKSVEKKELKTKLYKRKSVKLLSCLGVLGTPGGVYISVGASPTRQLTIRTVVNGIVIPRGDINREVYVRVLW